MAEDDDSAELLERIAARHKAALEVLYKRHASVALALARKVLGKMSDAEQVLEESFLEIWRDGAHYDAKRASADAWIFGIVRRRALERRHEARQRGHAANDLAGEARELASVSPLEEAQRREERLAIAAAVNSIPKELREALELAYFEGLTHEEIATRTGVSQPAVAGRIRSALEALRKALGSNAQEGA